jgi:EmrB/QacA subfamily drug resistance transporter
MPFTRKQISILSIVAVTSFMGTFLISSVNIALPEIEKSFNLNAVQLSWVVTSFLLSSAMFLLPAGRWSDIIGVRKFFKAGIIIFTLSSIASGFAPNGAWLILFRFIQGFGAALTSTTGPAILVSAFPHQHRGRVLGISVASVYLGLAFGPFVGGFITQYAGWRTLFYLSSVIGVVVAIIAYSFLGKDEVKNNSQQKISFTGTLFYMPGLFAMVYGSSQIPSITGWLLLLLGFIALIIFWIIESKSTSPVFETKLFTQNKLFAFSNIAALINYSATFAIVFLLSLYLQKIKALSPRDAGMILIAQPIVMAALSPVAGRLSDKIQPRFLATAGMSICTVGLAAFAFLTTTTPIWVIICLLVLMGLGFAMFSSPNMSTIMGSVDKSQYGLASGTSATMRVLGQITSMTIVTFFFAILFENHAVKTIPADIFMHAVKWGFISFTFICAAGIYFSFARGKVSRL